ncbi:MAG TPA: hypothetical protein DCZ40_10620 [Lachnospiraceae bacterium]|nr:hypothetical protein [Lachnospiraceae bacterium]
MFIFIIWGLTMIIKSYLPILLDVWKNNTNSKNIDNKISVKLATLKSCADSASKAAAFVALMDLSYVLVHTLVNKGKNYDDKAQSKKFRASLTADTMKRLKELEGRYE